MANEAIGHMKCHLCGSQRVRVSVMKNGKLCTTCSCCHFQGQARGPHADTYIRQAMTPVAAAPRMPEPAPGEEIAAPGALEAAGGVPPALPESKPAPKVEPAPSTKSAPEKKRSAWDIY